MSVHLSKALFFSFVEWCITILHIWYVQCAGLLIYRLWCVRGFGLLLLFLFRRPGSSEGVPFLNERRDSFQSPLYTSDDVNCLFLIDWLFRVPFSSYLQNVTATLSALFQFFAKRNCYSCYCRKTSCWWFPHVCPICACVVNHASELRIHVAHSL